MKRKEERKKERQSLQNGKTFTYVPVASQLSALQSSCPAMTVSRSYESFPRSGSHRACSSLSQGSSFKLQGLMLAPVASPCRWWGSSLQSSHSRRGRIFTVLQTPCVQQLAIHMENRVPKQTHTEIKMALLWQNALIRAPFPVSFYT